MTMLKLDNSFWGKRSKDDCRRRWDKMSVRNKQINKNILGVDVK